MIATATLQSLVASFLKINMTDYDRFEVLNNLNAAQRHLLSILPSHMISNAVKTSTGHLVANMRYYQYPADLIRVIRLWLSYSSQITSTNPGNVARMVKDPGGFNSLNRVGSTLYPVVGLEIEGGWEVMPVPTADQTNGYMIRYIYMLPTLSSGQDCLLPSQFTNLMVYYATMLSATVEGMYVQDLAPEMRQLYKEELELFLPKVEKN